MTYHNHLPVITDVWVPTERTAEGMKDTDKPRDKAFGLVQREKTFLDDIRNSLERAVEQSAVFEEKTAEGFVNGEDEMVMGTPYWFRRYSSRSVIGVLSAVGGAKPGVVAKGNELEVTAVEAAIYGTIIRRILVINDLINVFHDDRSGPYIVFNDFVVVSEHLPDHIHEIIIE